MPSTREVEKSWNLRKFDLWPAITGSNIDLGPKIIPPIASTRREQSAGIFREALRRFVWKRQGGVAPTPPPTPAKVAKHRLRARVNKYPPSCHSPCRRSHSFVSNLTVTSFVFIRYISLNTHRCSGYSVDCVFVAIWHKYTFNISFCFICVIY